MSFFCSNFAPAFEKAREVAQPGSATVWGTGGRVFESRLPDKRTASAVFFVEVRTLTRVFLSRYARTIIAASRTQSSNHVFPTLEDFDPLFTLPARGSLPPVLGFLPLREQTAFLHSSESYRPTTRLHPCRRIRLRVTRTHHLRQASSADRNHE